MTSAKASIIQLESRLRRRIVLSYCIGYLLVIMGLTFWVAPIVAHDHWLSVIVDIHGPCFPVSIQTIIGLIAMVALAELWVRNWRANLELSSISLPLLSAHSQHIYHGKQLLAVYQNIQQQGLDKNLSLVRLIENIILQFQLNGSTEQASQVLNTSLELMQHELDLKYNLLRYWLWLIPTLGFVGTVLGIGLALSAGADMPDISDKIALKEWVVEIISQLGVAFNTTLVALCVSALLMLFLHMVQEKEERALNVVGRFCLERLVNRLQMKANES